MTIKKYVADIYGNREGFKYNQISKDQIDIKIEYAQQFLDVVGKVDPGTTKVCELKKYLSLIYEFHVVKELRELTANFRQILTVSHLLVAPYKNVTVGDYEYNNKKMGRSLFICVTI